MAPICPSTPGVEAANEIAPGNRFVNNIRREWGVERWGGEGKKEQRRGESRPRGRTAALDRFASAGLAELRAQPWAASPEHGLRPGRTKPEL